MLTANDLIPLPIAPDLTPAGITYACRSLAYTYDRMGGSPAMRLQRIVAGIMVELAFRRHLSNENIPFDLLGATPFTDPDRYDVTLGGRRCDIKSFLIHRKDRIRLIHTRPEKLWEAHALVPVDQYSSDHLREEDLYIFAFLTALITPRMDDIQRALSAGQPVFLIHSLPNQWARPVHWRKLGRLKMKSESEEEINVEIGGQDEEHKFKIRNVKLPSGRRVQLSEEWYTVSYLSVNHLPPRRIGIHSPVLDATYIIHPYEWSNIWVYGMKIILAGYITRGEFRRRANLVPSGSQVFQYPRTLTDNMGVPLPTLHPMSDLFTRTQNWAQQFGNTIC
jgi:hypothetical protein